MSNAHLNKAKQARNDEFYTLEKDVEAELCRHIDHFRGKSVYCNCDDAGSAFLALLVPRLQ